jgi:hypothetical protein
MIIEMPHIYRHQIDKDMSLTFQPKGGNPTLALNLGGMFLHIPVKGKIAPYLSYASSSIMLEQGFNFEHHQFLARAREEEKKEGIANLREAGSKGTNPEGAKKR